MKKLLLILALALPVAVPAVALTGCAGLSTQGAKATQYTTLKVANELAKKALDSAASLLAQGRISVAQFEEVGRINDKHFRPTYDLAVNAARSDLSSLASPDLMDIVIQLSALVATYTPASNAK